MDLTSIVGLVIVIASVVIAMVYKEIPPSVLNNPAALSIILLGTIGVIAIATPGGQLKKIPKLFGILFGKQKFTTAASAIETMTKLSEMTRKEGLLVLEEQMKSIDDPFIVDGLKMLVDGADSNYIAEVLQEEIAALELRHAANAQIFAQAGTYAPTLGVLGAVMGLIAALGNMEDIEALGHAISAAFVATMLGIFTGYAMWHPFANKLKQKSKQEVVVKTLILEGILGLCEGQNPRMLRDRMLAQMAKSETKGMGKE